MRQVVTVRLKNMSGAPAVIYATNGQAVRIGPGETSGPVEVVQREAVRLMKAYEQKRGHLLVLDQSKVVRNPDPVKKDAELRDHAGKPQTEKKPGVKERRHNTDEESSSTKYARNKEQVPHPQIKTAAQALAAMSDGDPLSYPHLLSVATRILPEGSMPLRPKKAEIITALEKQARKDEKSK